MEPLVESTSTSWNFAALNISPTARSSLKQVYFTLCCALLSSGAGVMLNKQQSVGGLSTIISCMVCVAVLLTDPPSNEKKRFLLWMVTAALEGASISPLVELVIQLDYSILLIFVGWTIAFGCFAVWAMFAKATEHLYLGALLSSGVAILFYLLFAPNFQQTFVCKI
ncbi:unnamed protein product [Amaranthus hypochondriacus]